MKRRARVVLSLVVVVVGAQVVFAASALAAAGWTAYVANETSNSVTPFPTTTNIPEATITQTKFPTAVAITPNGKTAYAANSGDVTVTPINTATNTSGTPITVGSRAIGLAVTPDGRTVYVVAGGGVVIPIATATNQPGMPIKIGGTLEGIAITPDGRTAYVASVTTGAVIPINTATGTPGTPIPVGGFPFGIAITPDGRTVYVSIDVLAGTVVPINTATNTAGTPIQVGQNPDGIGITPNGRTAYVANRGSDTVTPINIATNAPGTAIPVGFGPIAIAITPDQAPTAALSATAAPAGAPSRFNGSASSTPVGSIASFQWNFGDGRSAITASPRTTHVYARRGVYTVRLTVTNTAGTSTTRVFTGQTVSNRGGPQATTAHALRVAGGSTRLGLSISPSQFSIPGRLVGGKCVKPTNKNKNKRHCQRPIRLAVSYTLSAASTVRFTVKRQSHALPGAIVKAGKAGRNSFVFDGVIGGQELTSGTYQLTATTSGGSSQTVTFKITS